MDSRANAQRVLDDAIESRVFPAAAVEVGSSRDVLWRHAAGRLTFDPDMPAADVGTPFDLASLTKPLATTTLVMEQTCRGTMRLEACLRDAFAEWRGADRDDVTIRDVLEHTAGLPARLPKVPRSARRSFERAICRTALEYEPRRQSVYSDLGFILLGFALEDRASRPLKAQFAQLAARLTLDLPLEIAFGVASKKRRAAVAPTITLDEDPRGRGQVLQGVVHDNYAAALAGAAGHAGLFGTAPAVGAFGRVLLRAARGTRDLPEPFAPDLVAQFTRRSAVPGSSRALGWDTMLPSSSCGAFMSTSAFGHAGFTGTSIWIDPARDRYFVLLTNRAYGGGTLEQMREVRRAFHDALGDL